MASTKPQSDVLKSSLIACLRFAAPLVRGDASPQSICSKAALGSMVVEAHRLTQQAAAQQLEMRDPRRLLNKLVSLDNQLAYVAFKDITWDSEGIVAQSLEMELQDVEERANASQLLNFCVLLAASRADGEAEAALLWFPRTDSDDDNNSSRKYLLYVAPGRIKIVKSLVELVKKMLEEIPSLRGTSATYRVWTLTEDRDEPKKLRKAVPPTSDAITSQTKRVVGSPTAYQSKLQESPEVHPMHSDAFQEPTALQTNVRALRVRAHEKNRSEQPSMFQFSRAESRTGSILRPRDSPSTPADVMDSKMTMGQVLSICSPPQSGDISENDAIASGSPIIQPTLRSNPLMRQQVSVSCVNDPQTRQRIGDDGFGWKSLDGDKRRLLVRTTPEKVVSSPATVLEMAEIVPQAVQTIQIKPLEQRDNIESIFQFSSSRVLDQQLLQHPEQVATVAEASKELPVECKVSPIVEPVNDPVEDKTPSEKSTAVKKKRSARDHYRSKLGARGWWELEYQATKILQQQQSSDRVAASGRDRIVYPHNSDSRALLYGRDTQYPVRTRSFATEQRKNDQECARTFVESTTMLDKASECMANHQRKDNGTEVYQPEELKKDSHETKSTVSTDSNECDPTRQDEVPDHSTPVKCSIVNASSIPTMVSKTQGDTSVRGSIMVVPTTKTDKGEDNISFSKITTSAEPAVHESSSSMSVRSYSAQRRPECDREFQTEDICGEIIARASRATPTTREARERQSSSSLFTRMQLSKHEGDEQDNVLMATMAPRSQYATKPDREIIHSYDNRYSRIGPHTNARPFHAQGRVPIRTRPHTKTQQSVSMGCSDNEEDSETIPQEPAAVPEFQQPTMEKPRGHSMGETFTVDSPVKARDAASQLARQQKLTELRQKKIQQLQKAHADARGKKKISTIQHQVKPVPIPIVSEPIVSISAAPPSRAPPSTIVGREDSFYTAGLVRVRKPSNRKLIQNAIEYTLLAGGSLDKERTAALEALSESICDNFIVLLKSAKELKFRALYEHHIERGQVVRIFSLASSSPQVLTDDVINQFFRYNSGKKEFTPIDAREFTVKTDACALVDQLVFKKKLLNRIL